MSGHQRTSATDVADVVDTPTDSRPLRVVIAPDSFKGSLAAAEVAAAIAAGWRAVRPHDELALMPQADGGEGTLDAIAASVPDATWHDTCTLVTGPDGRPTPGRWLVLPDGTAVLELAQMAGLPLMRTLDAGGATTRGLGEVIAAALDAGARSLCIGLGGSASTDGGAGALRALGLRLLDDEGHDLPDGGLALLDLDRADPSGLRRPPAGGIELLTDTTAVLTGAHGAAALFAGQKGADQAVIDRLDAALHRFANVLSEVLPADPTRPGAGAAGGTGFGLAAWNADLAPGADRIADLTGLSRVLGDCDVVITGEGRFDRTSLTGKLVGSLLHRCTRLPVTPIVIAGQLADQPPTATIGLTTLAGSARAAIADPQRWLHQAGAQAARTAGTPVTAVPPGPRH